MFDQPYPNFRQWIITEYYTHNTSYGHNITLFGYIDTPNTPIKIFMRYGTNEYNIEAYHGHGDQPIPSTEEYDKSHPIAKIHQKNGDETTLHLLDRLYHSHNNFHAINTLLHAILTHLYPEDLHARINIVIALTHGISLYPDNHPIHDDPLHPNNVNIFHWRNITDTSIDALRAWIGKPKIFYCTNNNYWMEKDNNTHILYHINSYLNRYTPNPPSMHTHIHNIRRAQALNIPFLPHCMSQSSSPT